jgi:gliding motility-associated-like protein
MCEGDTMKLIGNIIPSTYPFDLLWYPGASLNNSKVSTPVFTAQQTTTLSLTAASLKAKCKSSDTVVLTVYPSKFVTTKGDTAICPGNKTQLFAIGGGIKSISWYPAFNMSDKLISNPYVWPTTTTIYTVYAKDTNSCLDTADVKVTVRPSAIVYMPHEVTIYPGEFYKIEPSTNCTYFSWFPKLGLSNSAISNPIAQPVYSTKYVTIATTESGCTTKDSINIIVDPNSIINMPNAFTPGSEPNSTLKINYRGTIILSDFSIYNRYGQLIYRSIDPNKGWDGTFNGQPQPMGVYVYSVQGITNSGHKFNKQGNITLIR